MGVDQLGVEALLRHQRRRDAWQKAEVEKWVPMVRAAKLKIN